MDISDIPLNFQNVHCVSLVMQVRVIVVEELLEKKNGSITFPEYSKDFRLTKWSSGVEQISLPSSLITEKFGKFYLK